MHLQVTTDLLLQHKHAPSYNLFSIKHVMLQGFVFLTTLGIWILEQDSPEDTRVHRAVFNPDSGFIFSTQLHNAETRPPLSIYLFSIA